MEFYSDCEAWELLKNNGFTEDKFVIKMPKDHKITKDEWDAINYLCDAWDWAMEPYEPKDGIITFGDINNNER